MSGSTKVVPQEADPEEPRIDEFYIPYSTLNCQYFIVYPNDGSIYFVNNSDEDSDNILIHAMVDPNKYATENTYPHILDFVENSFGPVYKVYGATYD